MTKYINKKHGGLKPRYPKCEHGVNIKCSFCSTNNFLNKAKEVADKLDAVTPNSWAGEKYCDACLKEQDKKCKELWDKKWEEVKKIRKTP